MTGLGKTHDEVKVVMDQHGSPTYTEDLTNIIYQAVKKNIPYGVYHSTNQGFTTWYEFTQEFFKMQDINCKITPVTSEEFKSKAHRPANSQLSKDKLLNLGIEIPTWQDAVKRYLEVENNI